MTAARLGAALLARVGTPALPLGQWYGACFRGFDVTEPPRPLRLPLFLPAGLSHPELTDPDAPPPLVYPRLPASAALRAAVVVFPPPPACTAWLRRMSSAFPPHTVGNSSPALQAWQMLHFRDAIPEEPLLFRLFFTPLCSQVTFPRNSHSGWE